MRIEIAKHERMSESGSSLMRLIQNNELPTIDLLVRESIQNSSDAALRSADSVCVDYSTKTFNAQNANRHFEDIASKLDKKSENLNSRLLEVRDSNTTGLHGPLHYEDAVGNYFGNLINLIYEISKPQQKEGAGGSWGLGKTVYFRIGIGLVIYYTRVKKDNGEFESRLAACLIEDETAENTLLESADNGPKRGIAWWGEKTDSSRLDDKSSATIPLTDEAEINNILKDFNIEPFKDEETGTSIIIPYINDDKLIKNAKASQTKENWWTSSLEDYLNICVQRWYAPRIMNRSYPYNIPLIPSINGKRIDRANMLPVFKTIQDLYNQSIFSKGESSIQLVNEEKVYNENINLKFIFEKKGLAGTVAFAKLSREELLMTSPNNNANPLEHTNVEHQEDKDMNPPLIAYLRKPGMIVNYDASGSWVNNINSTSEDEYIIGLFIPNSNNKLKAEFDNVLLEEYLRKSEKADHTSWGDWTINDYNPQIVNKIKGHIGKKINNKYKENDRGKYERKNASVGKAVAEILLPPEKFGTQSGKPPKSTKGGNTKDPRTKSKLMLKGNPTFKNGAVSISFSLIVGSKVKSSQLELKVESEGGDIEANKWESEDVIGSSFPLRYLESKIDSIKVGKDEVLDTAPLALEGDFNQVDFSEIFLVNNATERFAVPYGMEIFNNSNQSVSLNGEITFKATQSNIQGALTSKDDLGDSK